MIASARERRRTAAAAAIALAVAAVVFAIVPAVTDFPRSTLGLALFALAPVAAWTGLVRRGALHVAGIAAGFLLAGADVAVQVTKHPGPVLGSLAALALGLVAASAALRARVPLPAAPRPARPVLFWNPRSGGGKAVRLRLAEEARARGIQPVEVQPGADLEQLVRDAVDAGADALAVAGGDGSQATVARIAADRGLPYACIPAGTRNHFALDLGVDRDDVVGALDALVDGGERRVDLGDVNGRTFVNNVSIGLYGDSVQRAGYRNAKIRTLLATALRAPDPAGRADLRWRSPDGQEHQGAVAIVVSNNSYRLGHVLGDGTRPRLDAAVVGIAVVAAPGDEPGARFWTTPSYEIAATADVPAGIDGEAVVLPPPLRFSVRPGALRCRIPRRHPGASPSAYLPLSPWDAIRALAGIAAGRDPRPVPGARPDR